jgi:hypothetical protein
MNLQPGHRYQVVTTPEAAAPDFAGEYVGELALAGELTAHEFAVDGRLPDMPPSTKQWYPVVLADEVVSAVELP